MNAYAIPKLMCDPYTLSSAKDDVSRFKYVQVSSSEEIPFLQTNSEDP